MASTSQSAASETETNVSPISSYFLDPSENALLVRVQPLLDGSNYHTWSRVMKLALVATNKFGFVDGSILVPNRDDAEEFQMWEQCNSMVLSWLLNSIPSSIAQSVMRWFNTAREVWNDLYERFYRGDSFRLYDILEELDSIKQGDLSITAYDSKLRCLWGELLMIRPLPECSCGASRVYKEHFDTDCVIRFLNGLNDTFAPVKSQILLSTPLPSVNQVFGMAINIMYERHLAYSLGHLDKVGVPVQAENNSEGFSSTHQHRNQSNGFKNNSCQNRKSVQRTFCGILGH